MEGGLSPWKTQKVINNSPSIQDYSKPLPPPPDGYYWEKNDEGIWQLLQHPGLGIECRANATIPTAIIEHVILPADTLPGICLRYGVSVVDIRRLNQFSGNAFRSKKVLQIPIQKGVPVQIQEKTPDIILQIFKNQTAETTEEAKFYLEESKWDLELALQAWKKDEEWNNGTDKEVEKFSKHMTVPTLVTPIAIESVPTIANPSAIQTATATATFPTGNGYNSKSHSWIRMKVSTLKNCFSKQVNSGHQQAHHQYCEAPADDRAQYVSVVVPARVIVTDGDLNVVSGRA